MSAKEFVGLSLVLLLKDEAIVASSCSYSLFKLEFASLKFKICVTRLEKLGRKALE